jgi:Na+/alanine symporter
LDIAKNAVFVGGVEYLADKTGSKFLWWVYAALFVVLLMHVNSYMQGPAVAGWLERRWGLGRRPAKIIGYVLTIVFLLAFIITSDQAINAVARAQAK